MDDNDFEDQIRLPNLKDGENSILDSTARIMRRDSAIFLQKLNSTSPAIMRTTKKEEVAFVRQKTKIESQIASLVNCLE